MKSSKNISYCFCLLFLSFFVMVSARAEERCNSKVVYGKKSDNILCVIYVDGEEWKNKKISYEKKDECKCPESSKLPPQKIDAIITGETGNYPYSFRCTSELSDLRDFNDALLPKQTCKISKWNEEKEQENVIKYDVSTEEFKNCTCRNKMILPAKYLSPDFKKNTFPDIVMGLDGCKVIDKAISGVTGTEFCIIEIAGKKQIYYDDKNQGNDCQFACKYYQRACSQNITIEKQEAAEIEAKKAVGGAKSK